MSLIETSADSAVKGSWVRRVVAPRPSFVGVAMALAFFQTLADLSFSFSAPVGFGHRYGANVVDGWVAVTGPPEWSEDDTASAARPRWPRVNPREPTSQ